ncbi:MAG: nitronate monooxygenase [Alphaproteobacteria bacterium]|jgi:nitronate monooxygenase|nr:nitronate monooxygenase [Alphaproteobacteria bacterium]MDP6566547.1 nitronate monooxygenase [Alphaproteobacteria bacterium]MDP6815916.1 nitronate monooxygenase [Alphaproteobacteria bacterium]
MNRVEKLIAEMALPVIAAPMFTVSNPAMALAVCAEGLMGTFPAHTTRSVEMLAEWLTIMDEGLAKLANSGGGAIGPFGVNLVVHPTNPRLAGDLDLCIEHKVPVILTSKGAPGEVFDRVHDYGGVVFHDIASARHAEKALEAGADGLIAVCGGAGGHCGTINPFALVNEVRQLTDKALILAGAVTTGRDVLAAQVMGADLVYMGTRFINTEESSASDGYRQMIVEAKSNDVFFTAAMDGAPANLLAASLVRAGVDLEDLKRQTPGAIISAQENKKRWKDVWSAGHGVGAIHDVLSVSALCDRLKAEYAEARAGLNRLSAVPA